MFKRSGWLALFSIAAWFVFAGPAQAQKSYSADRFDVDVVVQEDGSLQVTETVVFNFVGGPFTFVFRELPTDHTDGIVDIVASVDGQPGRVERTGRDPIRITWHLEPTSNTTRTFVLSYRVLGVVRQEDDSDLLLWQALPDEYEYAIASSTTTITYPSHLELVGSPIVQAGTTTITRDGSRISFTSQNLSPNSPLVVGLRFPAGTVLTAPPDWQARQETQSAQAPIWIAVGLAILASGLVAVVAQVSRHRPRVAAGKGLAYQPPDGMSPGVAAALLTADASPTWASALGTLFGLAEQGILEIDESPDKRWYRPHEFLLRQVTEPARPEPHEEALLDLIFTTRKGRVKTVKFSDLSKMVTSRRWRNSRKQCRPN